MNKIWSKFSFTIIIPSILSLLLFVLVIFLIIIPYFEESMMERKKEMIKELTNSAWSILNEMNKEVLDGNMTLVDAQNEAIEVIKNLKYGTGHKDYFWITDMQPKMIVHPYRPDLTGKDLTKYSDPKGKKLFVECVRIVKEKGEGYVDYMWQYKEDSTHIVPKLSYVRGFDNWQWVVGTGIYTEDVKIQMARLIRKLLLISIFISFVTGLILFYLVRINLITERKRLDISEKLSESYNKYKTLVEASTEGIVMVLDNKKVFYNLYILNLLGYSDEEFNKMSIYDILYEKEKFSEAISKAEKGEKFLKNFDTRLIKKNGELHNAFVSISRVSFQGEEGYIFAVKDISFHKVIEHQLGQNIEKFKSITNNIDIGIFRTTLGRKGRFTEINQTALELIGAGNRDEVEHINILDLVHSAKEKKEILNLLGLKKSINKQIIRVKRLDGRIISALISLFIVTDESGHDTFCDGIIQDVTMQKKLENEKDAIIDEMMAANMFMNQPIKTIARKISVCDINTSLQAAVNLMVRKKTCALLITMQQVTPVGIITSTDFGVRIISNKLDMNLPVAKIMSSPVISLPENAMVYEALLKMRENDINHICVENMDGSINEVVSIEEIAFAKNQTQTLLLQRIKSAETYEELKEIFDSIPLLLRMLIEGGAKTEIITRINSNFSDEISQRILELILQNAEEPPAEFVFIKLGSVGRGEQTFVTDQDNAMIYSDIESEENVEVKQYFLNLAAQFNERLHQVGYNYCNGEVMARNPKWCLSISEWEKQFNTWVQNSDPHDLMEVSIFFDINELAGNRSLSDRLRNYVYELVKNKDIFFYHLAENVLSIKPPISFFGNFIVESTKENKSAFNIKKVMMLITSIARLYAFKHNIKETTTLRRLKNLNTGGFFTDEQYQMLSKNFSYLMLMRMNHQLDAIKKQIEPDNLINPKHLTDLERTTLKKIFSQLSDFQAKISLDFKGSI